ncbi:MAG: pitrilysin family protein [Bacteroidota bacterium]
MSKNTLTIHQKTLPNGLRVVVSPNHNAAVVCITLSYKVGSKNETPDIKGFAHLFEHLMFEGSANVPKGEFDKYCSQAGGTNNAYTSYDQTTYYMVLPSHQTELGMWLESDRMLKFAVTPKALETQQKVVTEEISQTVENQPYGRWRTVQGNIAYTPESAYSWEVYGSKERVAAATMENVKSFYEQFYRPDNACLVITGDITEAKAFELSEKYFGEISPNEVLKPALTFKNEWRKSGYDVLKDSVPLNAVFLSFHIDGFLKDSIHTADILAALLGEGRSARLYQSLIYEKQIASSVGAFVDKREGSSLFTVLAIAADENVSCETLEGAIQDELLKIIETEVEDHELLKAKNSLQTQLAHELQTSSGTADIIASQVLFWNDANRIHTILEKYGEVHAKDIRKFAVETFIKGNMIRVDVVPNGEVSEKIE